MNHLENFKRNAVAQIAAGSGYHLRMSVEAELAEARECQRVAWANGEEDDFTFEIQLALDKLQIMDEIEDKQK